MALNPGIQSFSRSDAGHIVSASGCSKGLKRCASADSTAPSMVYRALLSGRRALSLGTECNRPASWCDLMDNT